MHHQGRDGSNEALDVVTGLLHRHRLGDELLLLLDSLEEKLRLHFIKWQSLRSLRSISDRSKMINM